MSTRTPNAPQIHPTVTQLLSLLAEAHSVVAGGPLVTDWETNQPTGHPDNKVLLLRWIDGSGNCACTLTEGGIAAGLWQGDSFICEAAEGGEVQLSLYRHVSLAPTCKQCGSALEGEYCSDHTCGYSEWPQAVTREDLKVFSADELESKYGLAKREVEPA